MVVYLGEHARDIDIRFIEGTDGAHAGESRSKLFEDGGLGAGFKTLCFSCACHIESSDLNTYNQEGKREYDNVGGDKDPAKLVKLSGRDRGYSPCNDYTNQAEHIIGSKRHIIAQSRVNDVKISRETVENPA
jgi:hypothetical protein